MLHRLRQWTPRPPGRRGLTHHVLAGSALDAETSDAMWELRRSIFPLKPEVDPAADREAFGRRVVACQRNALLRDDEGRIRGTFCFHWRRAPDGSALWLWPEYGFLDAGYRGHPAYAWTVLRGFARALRIARGQPVWFAGVGYPRGHQSLDRAMGRTWTLGCHDLPDAGRACLEAQHHAFHEAHWDRSTHRVWLPTLPVDRRPRAASPAWDRFERHCPNWTDGYGLGLTFRVEPARLLRSLRELPQRRQRNP